MAFRPRQARLLFPLINGAWRVLCCLAALNCLPSLSRAGQLEAFSVTEEDGEYKARVAILLDAPADYVYGVITDYKHIYRLHPSIIESEILPAEDDATVRVRNRFEHCIALFCMEVEMVEDIMEVGDGTLVATTVPALSSFASGNAVWHVHAFEGGRARVQYQANMKPDFFIPPLIGSLIIKSRLRREIMTSFSRIECHARIVAMGDLKDIAVRMAERTREKDGCAG